MLETEYMSGWYKSNCDGCQIARLHVSVGFGSFLCTSSLDPAAKAGHHQISFIIRLMSFSEPFVYRHFRPGSTLSTQSLLDLLDVPDPGFLAIGLPTRPGMRYPLWLVLEQSHRRDRVFLVHGEAVIDPDNISSLPRNVVAPPPHQPNPDSPCGQDDEVTLFERDADPLVFVGCGQTWGQLCHCTTTHL
jgi:hypothetical protein